MKVSILVNNEAFDLYSNELVGLVNRLEDFETRQKLLAVLADHPDAEVREAVANFECISNETYTKLINDEHAQVAIRALDAGGYKRTLTFDMVGDVLNKGDIARCEAIAENIDNFAERDKLTLAHRLLNMGNHGIKLKLMRRPWASNNFALSQLVQDDDQTIALEARARLADID